MINMSILLQLKRNTITEHWVGHPLGWTSISAWHLFSFLRFLPKLSLLILCRAAKHQLTFSPVLQS